MTDHLNHPILVTGLPRSGTSMVAGLFHTCGAWTGTTVPGNDNNPKGYFEHVTLRETVTKEILTQLGHDPLGVKSVPPIKPSMKVDGLGQIVENIIRKDGYRAEQPWLYKGAKMSLIWPVFNQAFPEAQWIIVRRSVDSVIESCLRTRFMAQHSTDRKFWEQFAEAYLVRLELLEKTAAHVTSIQSEDILQGDYASLRSAIERCSLEFKEPAVRDFICGDYWHDSATA